MFGCLLSCVATGLALDGMLETDGCVIYLFFDHTVCSAKCGDEDDVCGANTERRCCTGFECSDDSKHLPEIPV